MAFSLEYSCRICLDNNALLNIYLTKRSHNSAKVACDEMMIAVFCLKVTQDDELPSKICRKCFSKLSSAYKLKKLAENSHNTLYEYFAKNNAATVNEVYREILKEEIKVEYDVKEEVLDEKPQLTGNLTGYKTDVGDLTGESDGGGDDALAGDFVFDEEALTDTMFLEVDENLQPGNLDKNGEDMAEELKPLKRRSLIKEKKKLKTEVKVKVKRKAGEKKERVRAVCPLCGKLVADMDTHSETHKPPGEKRRLPCPQCSKLFVSQSSRRRHVLVHHLGQLYFCQICNKNFKHGDQHMRMVHPVRPKPLGCPLCDKRFFTKAPLEIHLTSHTKERAFPCSVCGKGFRTHTDSEIHRRSVHEKERNIICQFCPKGFFSNADLNKHLCTHTKEKKYKCMECDKCFYRSNQLKLHLRRHRGIKDVQCTLCHKAFYTQGNLQTHMISHTKEKNYPCKYCGVKFGRTHHRDRHQRTAHESKPDKEATTDKADQDHID